MTATIEYLGDLRTKAIHIKSGAEIITDAPTDNHGKGASFSPTDLASCSLASCILTIMGIAANTHEINIIGTKATMIKHMSSNPRRIGKIEIVINMPDLPYTYKEKTILEKAAHHCPVALSLNDNTKEEIHIEWAK